jgi:hypothetical protein
MATRSLIGMELDNGITKIIYCHFDGYPEHVGKLLVHNYNTPALIITLMELGDLSSLDATPATCTAYHRDRNEPWGMVEPRDINTSEIVSEGDDYGVDYIYIYKNECEWECLKSDGTPVNILADVA